LTLRVRSRGLISFAPTVGRPPRHGVPRRPGTGASTRGCRHHRQWATDRRVHRQPPIEVGRHGHLEVHASPWWRSEDGNTTVVNLGPGHGRTVCSPSRDPTTTSLPGTRGDSTWHTHEHLVGIYMDAGGDATECRVGQSTYDTGPPFSSSRPGLPPRCCKTTCSRAMNAQAGVSPTMAFVSDAPRSAVGIPTTAHRRRGCGLQPPVLLGPDRPPATSLDPEPDAGRRDRAAVHHDPFEGSIALSSQGQASLPRGSPSHRALFAPHRRSRRAPPRRDDRRRPAGEEAFRRRCPPVRDAVSDRSITWKGAQVSCGDGGEAALTYDVVFRRPWWSDGTEGRRRSPTSRWPMD